MKKFSLLLFFLVTSLSFSQDIFMGNGTIFNQCSGNFYDSGGASSSYGSNETFVVTICPENPGQLTQLDFTSFSTQINADILNIYNGDSTAAPLFGNFSGGPTGSPGFVSATEDNTSGCLTIEFLSDGANNGPGWAATISCFTPCQIINAQLDSSVPAPNGDGYIRVCPDEPITLNGSGDFSTGGAGATYEWDLGDGNTFTGQTATFSYSEPGVYIVNLNINDTNTSPAYPDGCSNNNLINQVIQVGTEPDFSGTRAAQPTICFGDSVEIFGSATPVEFLNDCTPPASDVTVLPDQSGATYNTAIAVDCYDSGQTITDVNQIVEICVDIEHSYSGDLDIFIISPNGQQAQLFENTSSGGTYFGGANNLDNQVAGVGATYCFSMNASVLLANAPTIIAGSNPPAPSFAPGTYLPVQNFNALIGSPLNGNWTIRIVDNLGIDDGTVFGWTINFDPNLQPPEYSFTPAITSETWDTDPTITATNGNNITVTPPTAGTYCYTYRATDDFGCEYSKEVCIIMEEELFADVVPMITPLCQGEDAEFLVTGPANAEVSYTINGGGVQIIVLDASGNGTVSIANPPIDQTIVLTQIQNINPPTTAHAIDAIGAFDSPNAIGDIQPAGTVANNTNSARLDNAYIGATLTLADMVPAGTVITISAAKNTNNGNMTVTNGTNTITINTGALNTLGYFNFTTTVPTDTLTFSRIAGTMWIDGVSYTLTNEGCILTLNDTETIFVGQVFDTTFSVTPDCNGASVTVSGDTGGVFSFLDPQPTDGAVIDPATGEITNGVGGTSYTVSYNFPGNCTTGTNQSVTLLPSDDATFSLTPTCDGATASVTGLGGGSFALTVTDGAATIDGISGTVTGATQGITYTVQYTTNGACPFSTTQDFTTILTDDGAFALTPTCDGATANVTGDAGGTFALNPDPADGATVDSATGALSGASQGVSYTVQYTTNGVCPVITTQTVTAIITDDPSFILTATCDGATATVTGLAGGTFTFNPPPTDAAVINASNGTITNGTSAATYTVEYLTSGPCPSSSTQSVTVITSDDATFTMTPTCDGGTALISGTPGGTFTFNPAPSDTAVIDPMTGTVTGGTSGSSYTVQYTTNGTCPLSSTQILNVILADDSSFTMTATCDGAMATVDGLAGGTFAFNPVPSDTAVIDPLSGLVTGATASTSYTVEYTTNGTCPTLSSETFTVLPMPVVVAPTPLVVCDDNVPDGLTSIDLSVKDVEITGNNPQYVVSYHLNQLDANNGSAPFAIPYTNISNPQIVYVRVEIAATGCYDTTTLELQVEQAPVANVPLPLEYCDADSDGIGVFTLTDADAQITGGASGLTVTYHETMADAENDVNAQASPYNNIVVYMQTLYVRIESETIATDCATIVELQLLVKDTPQIVDPTPLEVCDNSTTDGISLFDLTTKNEEILGGLDPAQYAVSYYELQADAEVPTSPIASPNAYTNTTAFNQTLWVRVDDTANGCYKLSTLDLVVNALPVLIQPTALTLCDVNNPGDQAEAFTLEDAEDEILNGQTGITLSYHFTQLGANTDTDEIVSPYTNTSNAQTIYVRAVNSNTGCISTITLDLRVNPLPSLVAPTPIRVCDGDNDGIASFDLETRTLQIINGESDITVTYHETLEDANNGQNDLVSPYDNIVANTQIVYVRKENDLTGCYRIIELTLNVQASPVVPTDIADYIICDTDSNGLAQFDLTTKIDEILDGQDPSQYTLSFHTSQANADSGASPITNPANFTNSINPQTIYVRVVGSGNGCVKTGQFEIRVELPPTAIQPLPLSICDDDVADQMTSFDLTVKDAEITGGNGSWSVTYYTTSANAQADNDRIDPATDYVNMSVNGNAANPQTLYVRVTDTATGCTDFTTLTIRVLPNPTPTPDPADMELCDDINTGDGQEVFNLTLNEGDIINFELNVSATYYETLEDAEAGMNEIDDPTMYTNTNTDFTPQTIYVRVENDITGCYTIVDFDIVVNPLPELELDEISDYIICEVNTNGFAQFYLSDKDEEILNGQDASQFTVTYHTTQAGADNLSGALLSPYTNASSPQQIFVAITNNTTGCSISTASFNIEVDNGAEANSDMDPIEHVICDNIGDNEGLGQFDLTENDLEVLDGQDPLDFIVTYYTTEENAEMGVDPIPYTYENISNPQIIYVRVDNDTPDAVGMDSSICYAVTELTLRVDLLPIFDLEDTYTICGDTNGTEVLGAPFLNTGLSTIDYTFEWSLNGDVLPGETGSSLTAQEAGSYSVLVTNIITGCENSDITEVLLSSPPAVTVEVTTEAFADNHVIVATATGDGVYEYSLDEGPWQESGTFEGVSFGWHIVTARDINGCGKSFERVMVMDYPHFFTPNGDGRNETWNIVGFRDQANAKIYIFDRFGKLIKQISPAGNGWNGTYNGKPMPSSDYWFTVEYSEPSTGQQKQFNAHFTLKR
ncbi:MAG: T9SS type B sorting domain-containing protein [Aquaticitalea sp.]